MLTSVYEFEGERLLIIIPGENVTARFSRSLRKPSTIIELLLTHIKSRQTNNVRHPRFHSCNYHCRVPHTEGHLEPKKEKSEKFLNKVQFCLTLTLLKP